MGYVVASIIGTDSGYDIDGVGVGVEQASNRDLFAVAAQQLSSEVERSNGSGYFAAVYIAIDVESGFLPIESGCCLGNRQRPNVAAPRSFGLSILALLAGEKPA